MTKRKSVLKKIRAASRRHGYAFTIFREGANHTIYDIDGTRIPIGRHSELDNDYVRIIYKELEPKLGKDWWR